MIASQNAQKRKPSQYTKQKRNPPHLGCFIFHEPNQLLFSSHAIDVPHHLWQGHKASELPEPTSFRGAIGACGVSHGWELSENTEERPGWRFNDLFEGVPFKVHSSSRFTGRYPGNSEGVLVLNFQSHCHRPFPLCPPSPPLLSPTPPASNQVPAPPPPGILLKPPIGAAPNQLNPPGLWSAW